jgi:urease accessory protein UreE
MLYTFFYQMILNAKLDNNKIKEKKKSNRTLTKLDLKQDKKKKTRKRYTRK